MAELLIDEVEELVLLEVAVQGPPGPAGSVDSNPGKTLVYDTGRLSEVLIYSDAAKTNLVERRVLGYTGQNLTTIQFYDGTGTLTKTRTLTYTGSVLAGYSDT